MSDSMSPAVDAPLASVAAAAAATPITAAEVARATPAVGQGARWFWWIAGLTLVNIACDAAHASINFVLGLAFSQLGHAIFASSAGIAYAIDAVLIGGFFLLGQQAQRGRSGAFAVGAALFLCDGLIYLKYGDMLPVAFHALALFYIGKGFVALRTGLKAARLA